MLINFNKKMFVNKYKNWIKKCFEEATMLLNIHDFKLEVNIAFVSNNEIKSLNKNFRGIDKVTDVLSFPVLDNIDINNLSAEKYPMDVNNETGNVMLGDLYICVNKVKKQRKEYGTSMKREMCYMALHGLLHLLGYDHIEENDKKIMRKKEEEILSKLNIFKDK